MNQDENTPDLAWWQIQRWVPVWPRALAIVVMLEVVYGLVIGLGDGIAYGFHGLYLHDLRDGLVSGAERGLVIWLVAGFGFVLVTDPGARLSRQRQRRRWWNRTDLRATLTRGLAAGLAVKLIVGLILGIGGWLVLGAHPWRHGLVGGLIPALGVGFAVGLGRRSRQQSGLQPPDRPDTRTILIAAIIGFTIALQIDYGLGFAFVVVVGLGGRPPRQLGLRQWNRTARRTALLTGLVTGLVTGSAVGLDYGSFKGLWFGVVAGLGAGLGFGLVLAILTALSQPSTQAANPITPRSLWKREGQFGLFVGIGVGFAVALLTIFRSELPNGPNEVVYGLTFGLLTGLPKGLLTGLGAWLVSSATWTTTLACGQLRLQGGTPRRLLRFLDDARDPRQILRTVGPVYQFRHARLQDRLAQYYADTQPVQRVRNSRAADPTQPGAHDVTGGHEAREAG